MNPTRTFPTFLTALAVLSLCIPLAAQTPEWIWHEAHGAAPGKGEVRFFRKSFSLDAVPATAELSALGDDEAAVFLNGRRALVNKAWNKAVTVDVTRQLKAGTNLLAARVENGEGEAAFLAVLELTFPGGRKQKLVTDTSWTSSSADTTNWNSPAFAAADWKPAASKGRLGIAPWGAVVIPAPVAVATPASAITVPPGFKVELLRSAERGEGSWVGMTIDNHGRLIISPQGGEPLLRVTLDEAGRIANLEKLDLPIHGAMGMLYAFNSLYVNARGPEGYHLYRLRDTDGKGRFGPPELLRKWNADKGGDGEHGAHGIVLGPDNKLYMVLGNFVDVPPDILPTSPHRNYADDLVLPRMEDGNGFGAGRQPPGGYVLRCDADGKNAELFASGQRNTYDIAFNPDGELFGFDSDMEWDWGAPWYRPTRVFQVVSGGDSGFREGSAKWPEYYADSLPAAVNIGIGSPTGVEFGTGARFPLRFQQALYAMDWSYGRILAVHLQPQGAGYSGTFEPFVKGAPLNVTDLEIGKDGAMYFTTGGRGTQSGLYRVSYVGDADRRLDQTVTLNEEAAAIGAIQARETRRQLERFHGHADPRALELIWPSLNSPDRFVRYAARVALESQPLAQWRVRALAETNANAGLTALLALSRVGGRDSQRDVLQTLGRWPLDSLTEEQKLEKLRVIEVNLARHGKPAHDLVQLGIEKLGRQYPAASWPLNRELSQLLIFLEAPGVVTKTLDLVARSTTQEEQLHYMVALRNAKSGWTMEDRTRYFSWLRNKPLAQDGSAATLPGAGGQLHPSGQHPAGFNQWFADVALKPANGASYANFLKNLRKAAAASLSDSERSELAALIADAPAAQPGPAREHKFVREWKMTDLTPDLDKASSGRSFASGKEAYAATQCAACHRLGNEGGGVGPDMTGIATRYARRDILEAILDPGRVVSEQYQNSTLTKKDGDDITGRILDENEQRVVVRTDPFKGTTVEIRKSEIASRIPSKVSPMPEGLVNILTREEILDLLAYVESGGRSDARAFAKDKP